MLLKLQNSQLGKLSSATRIGLAPLHYGLVAVIVLMIVLAGTHVIPTFSRDLTTLRAVQAVDAKGVALEGELQREVQENRRDFLRILLSTGNAAEAARQSEALLRVDAAIQDTNSRIAQIGVVPELNQSEFRETWLRYVSAREKMLAAVRKGDQDGARRIDADLGKSAFVEVQQAVLNGQQKFEANSSSHVKDVTQELSGVLREMLAWMGFRFLMLVLLIWLDWRRLRAERKLARTTRELKLSEERFLKAYDSATVGMGMFKLDGTVLSTNKRGAEILGYEVGELLGRKVSEFMAPESREDHVQKIATLPGSSEDNYQSEQRVLRKDGSFAWVRNSVTLLKLDGQEGQYFSISEEITRQKEANDRLAYLANYDPVANLPNRHFFEELLAEALRPTAGFIGSMALLYIEIDSFDFLKGTFGRTVADEVLGELGGSLAELQVEGEILGRVDDHVFAMLLPGSPSDEGTFNRANEVRALFHLFSESGKHRIPLSASIGVAFSAARSEAISNVTSIDVGVEKAQAGNESLMKYARAAMMEARLRGGDCIYLADPALQERAAQRHKIELALLRGLREDEFRVVFQPQFEVASGKLIRFEALCRWTSAELGPIPPDRFIPIAEQTGLIMDIGKRVMIDALRQAKKWTDAGRQIGVAVNISPMQFMRPDFPNTVTEVLAVTQFPPELLELEITEGIFIRDLNLAVARIRELQRLGLSIALDDFGTGYSSLSYLQRMPIDAVKLDRSFVSDLTTETATVSMVKSVLAMAAALNLRVVAEGIETEQQLDILKSLGCDEAQGYLMGRPESSDMAFTRVLATPLYLVKASVA